MPETKPFPGTTPGMDRVEKTIHDLTFDVGLRAGFTAVYAYVPFLAYPVIKQVFEYCITKFFDIVYKELSLGVLTLVIDFKTEAEQAAYEKATVELKAQLQKAEQNVEELKAAQEEFKKKLADLIRFPRPK